MYSVAVSPDGRHIVGGTGEGTVVVWDLATVGDPCRYSGMDKPL